jgi:CO/xanthine dehydrogenase FAD-binding subunit
MDKLVKRARIILDFPRCAIEISSLQSSEPSRSTRGKGGEVMFMKRLPPFIYHRPQSVSEALNLLSERGSGAKLMAGGTDLLVAMKKREISPEHLINLKGIAALKGITYNEKDGLRIGPLTTLEELERSPIVKDRYPMLWDTVRLMASPQVRSLATVGGNLCGAVPSADTAPTLIVLGASAGIAGPAGQRSIEIEHFFKGPKQSALEKDEILVEILVPGLPKTGGGTYLKLMRRAAMDLALVGVAVYLRLDAQRKTCREARIALGAVAPTPIRAFEAEAVLIKGRIDESIAAEAGKVASRVCSPIGDIRSSLEYRCSMVEVLTKRAVMEAYRRIVE